jgi:hypothetical protein
MKLAKTRIDKFPHLIEDTNLIAMVLAEDQKIDWFDDGTRRATHCIGTIQHID